MRADQKLPYPHSVASDSRVQSFSPINRLKGVSEESSPFQQSQKFLQENLKLGSGQLDSLKKRGLRKTSESSSNSREGIHLTSFVANRTPAKSNICVCLNPSTVSIKSPVSLCEHYASRDFLKRNDVEKKVKFNKNTPASDCIDTPKKMKSRQMSCLSFSSNSSYKPPLPNKLSRTQSAISSFKNNSPMKKVHHIPAIVSTNYPSSTIYLVPSPRIKKRNFDEKVYGMIDAGVRLSPPQEPKSLVRNMKRMMSRGLRRVASFSVQSNTEKPSFQRRSKTTSSFARKHVYGGSGSMGWSSESNKLPQNSALPVVGGYVQVVKMRVKDDSSTDESSVVGIQSLDELSCIKEKLSGSTDESFISDEL